MKSLEIDDQYSVVYDETQNDRPIQVNRYGQTHVMLKNHPINNWVIAMFYALLEVRGEAEPDPEEKSQEAQASFYFNNDPDFDPLGR